MVRNVSLKKFLWKPTKVGNKVCWLRYVTIDYMESEVIIDGKVETIRQPMSMRLYRGG